DDVRRKAAHVVGGYRANAIEDRGNRVAPARLEARAERQRVRRQRQRVGEVRLGVHFDLVVLRVRHGAPADVEVLADVEARSGRGGGDGGGGRGGPETRDREATHDRPGRVDRERYPADDLRRLDAPEIRAVRQAADPVLRDGRQIGTQIVRESRQDDVG